MSARIDRSIRGSQGLIGKVLERFVSRPPPGEVFSFFPFHLLRRRRIGCNGGRPAMNHPQREAGTGDLWGPIGTWRGLNRQKLSSQAARKRVDLCRATMQPRRSDLSPTRGPSNGEDRQARDGIVGSGSFVRISQRICPSTTGFGNASTPANPLSNLPLPWTSTYVGTNMQGMYHGMEGSAPLFFTYIHPPPRCNSACPDVTWNLARAAAWAILVLRPGIR